MKYLRKYSIFAFLLFFTTAAAAFNLFLDDKRYQKENPYSNERELKVNIESAFGKLVIGKCDDETVFSYDILRNPKLGDPTNEIKYTIVDRIGYLEIPRHGSEQSKKKSFHISSLESEKWILDLTGRIPISLDIQLGAGKGNFDFTGLKLKDLDISTGASSVTIMFNKLNQQTIENLNIETGVSRFKAYNLSNANFNRLKFSGGIGSYELDFSGELNKEVDVDIEIGLGSITILIPKYVGAKVYYEKNWISNIDLDKDFDEEQNNEYETSNYSSASGKMNIQIEAGFGSVKIKRLK